MKIIIIKGNPIYIKDNPIADNFYQEIAKNIRSKGCDISFDSGEPHTIPDETTIAWIAHSRGGDRLQYAPDSVKTLDLTSYEHPIAKEHNVKQEALLEKSGLSSLAELPQSLRLIPPKEHYFFTEEMKNAINRLF